MQSVHVYAVQTHFSVFVFFLKKAPWRPSHESLFEAFFTNYVIFVWKIGSKNCFKKRCPSRLKQKPIPMPGGSRRGSLACALFRQETVVRAAVEALFEHLAEKGEMDWKWMQKTDWIAESLQQTLIGLLKNVKKVNRWPKMQEKQHIHMSLLVAEIAALF